MSKPERRRLIVFSTSPPRRREYVRVAIATIILTAAIAAENLILASAPWSDHCWSGPLNIAYWVVLGLFASTEIVCAVALVMTALGRLAGPARGALSVVVPAITIPCMIFLAVCQHWVVGLGVTPWLTLVVLMQALLQVDKFKRPAPERART